ncbi:FAD-binding domain protein [Ceratobasidium sp. AG-Ba]|nr:FAD-binding domain protein [Ceratobasidium sp. AG-Ba]
MVVQYVLLALILVLVIPELLWLIARSYALNTTTALGEVGRLRSSRVSGYISGKAVIAGGSIAGLATAIVCSRFFEQVIIVEPDSMSKPTRSRVAQSEQIHAIHAISLAILRGIIPNFDERVPRFGGRILEADLKFQLGTTDLKSAPGTLPDTVFISRLSLEHLLRDYIQEIPNVDTIQGIVTGVVPDATNARISKAIIQLKEDEAATINLETAILADCSGPAAISWKLLEKAQGAGWGPYPKLSYDPKISYATALVPIADRLRRTLPIFTREVDGYSSYEKLGYLKGLIPNADQDDRIACMIRTDDDNRGWDLSPDMRPLSFADYIQQIDSIWQNITNGALATEDPNRTAVMDSLYAIESALTDDEVVPHFKFCKASPCHKIDYSKAPLPSNFVAVGDSFLRVNPVYGQGVSKALIDVASLNGALLDAKLSEKQGYSLPDTFSLEMIARQHPRVMHMWDSTKDSDYGRRSTVLIPGESSDLGSFGRNYWRRILGIASQVKDTRFLDDKATAVDVIKSLQLIAPPLDLLRPSLFIRAIWNIIQGN